MTFFCQKSTKNIQVPHRPKHFLPCAKFDPKKDEKNVAFFILQKQGDFLIQNNNCRTKVREKLGKVSKK